MMTYRHFIDALNGRRELDVTAYIRPKIGGGLFQFVLTTIVAVALHRIILLGERKPGQFIYLAFGKAELIFILLPVVGFILIGIPLFALTGAAAYLNAEFWRISQAPRK